MQQQITLFIIFGDICKLSPLFGGKKDGRIRQPNGVSSGQLFDDFGAGLLAYAEMIYSAEIRFCAPSLIKRDLCDTEACGIGDLINFVRDEH